MVILAALRAAAAMLAGLNGSAMLPFKSNNRLVALLFAGGLIGAIGGLSSQASAQGLKATDAWLWQNVQAAVPAYAQQCRSYSFAALIGMIEGRCADYLAETPFGEKTYVTLVRIGRAEVKSCATREATTEKTLFDMGFLSADGMIDKLAGTTIYSPKNAQTLTKQCNALAKILDSMSSGEPLYKRK